MVFRRLDAELTLNSADYIAALRVAATETRTFSAEAIAAGKEAEAGFEAAATGAKSYSAAVAESARANVDARLQESASIAALRAEYQAIADAAVKGSAEQVAATKLVEDADKRLVAAGLEVKATNAAVAESSAAAEAGFLSIGNAALAVGVGIAGMAVEGVKHLSDLGSQVRQVEFATGSSADASSRMIFTLKELGVSTDSASAAFTILGKNINDSPAKFDALGVAIARNKAGNVDELATLENLRVAYQNTADQGTKMAIVKDLLGKGGASLAPYLTLDTAAAKQFNAEAGKMGQVMNDQSVAASHNLDIAMESLHASVSGLEMTLGRDLVPALASAADRTSDLVARVQSLGSHVGEVIDRVPAATHHMGLFGEVVRDVGHAVGETAVATLSFGLSTYGDGANKSKEATAAFKDEMSSLGIQLGKGETSLDTLSATNTKAFNAIQTFKGGIETTAASVGLSADSMLHNIGVFGQVAPADFDAVTAAAKATASAVQQGVDASSAAFLNTTDAVSHFSASSLEAAAQASTKAAGSIQKDDTRVADAIQHVADLQEQFAEQAATARQSYADKVTQSDQKLADAEASYADTVDSTNQRIADADQKLADDRISSAQSVADAEKRLEDDRTSGAQSVADAQQRLEDEQQRQALARNPAALKRLNDQIQLRDAQAAVSKAQASAADKEQSDLDAIAKAKQNQIRTLAADQDAADRTRLDAAKQVEKAEDAVAAARADEAKLAQEGLTLGDLTLSQQREMRDAVAAVGKAQEEVAASAATSTSQVAAAVGVSTADVQRFYDQSTANAMTFEQGIHDAIARGYDPQFVADILKEGPTEAAPIIQAIVNDHDGTLRGIVNAGQDAIKHISDMNIETAHLTYVATTSVSAQTRSDFQQAMSLMQQDADRGGHLTADALADAVGSRRDDVERIFNEYGLNVESGLNPILHAIGADEIKASFAGLQHGEAGPHLALGGMVEGSGSGDTVAAMLTPGEVVFSRPAVDRIGAANLLALHEHARRGFASGGFVTASDVPAVPDYSAFGSGLGYSAERADRYAYDKVVDYLRSRPGGRGGLGTSGGGGGDFEAWLAEIGREKHLSGGEIADLRIIGWGESGGRNIAQGVDDVNSRNGTPAFGPFQVIEPTFEAYKDAGHDDWHNPVDSGDAAVNYARSRYGSLDNVPGVVAVKEGRAYQGYELGGLVEAVKGLHIGGVMDRGGWLEPGWNLVGNGLGVREPVGVTAGWGGPGGASGGDIVVNVTVQGSMLGDTKRLADQIAEPLRAIYAKRGQSVPGDYFARR